MGVKGTFFVQIPPGSHLDQRWITIIDAISYEITKFLLVRTFVCVTWVIMLRNHNWNYNFTQSTITCVPRFTCLHEFRCWPTAARYAQDCWPYGRFSTRIPDRWMVYAHGYGHDGAPLAITCSRMLTPLIRHKYLFLPMRSTHLRSSVPGQICIEFSLAQGSSQTPTESAQ